MGNAAGQREFDVVYPLGAACMESYQLFRMGLIHDHGPFDFLGVPMASLLKVLRARFDGYMALENLRIDVTNGRLIVTDTRYDITNEHDFLLLENPDGRLLTYPQYRMLIDARIQSFLAALRDAEHVLFVRRESDGVDLGEIQELRALLAELRHGKPFELISCGHTDAWNRDWGIDDVRVVRLAPRQEPRWLTWRGVDTEWDEMFAGVQVIGLRSIIVAANYTVDPLIDVLDYWSSRHVLYQVCRAAPYDQVFQLLLDPESSLRLNRGGTNVILLRLEDWARARSPEAISEFDEFAQRLEENVAEFCATLANAVVATQATWLVGITPPSNALTASPLHLGFLRGMAATISRAAAKLPGCRFVDMEKCIRAYGVTETNDPDADMIAHIPYTEAYFAAAGTTIARACRAARAAPAKVLALDADNTLWGGIVGEEGAAGVRLDGRFRTLQAFAKEQSRRGILLCLISKNNLADVREVFGTRPELILRFDDFVAVRANWEPKSCNILSIAKELNLGLDSFVFLDDSAMEIDEVRRACPGVVTVLLPDDDSRFDAVLHSIWSFDRTSVTEEDTRRAQMYKENAAREDLRATTSSIDEFIAGLEVNISISEMRPSDVPRISQLTLNTNQFNFTTLRRNEAEIAALSGSGHITHTVTASDRFGSYGLVGLTIARAGGAALFVDTFLLSCRALGRRVEHRMLEHLAEIAHAHNCSEIVLSFVATAKNQPARRFLESLSPRPEWGGPPPIEWRMSCREIPDILRRSNPAAADTIARDTARGHAASSESISGPVANERLTANVARLAEIAEEALRGDDIADRVRKRRRHPDALAQHQNAPVGPLESTLAALWADVLGFQQVGRSDDFFKLGGTSLLGARLVGRISRHFGVPLALSDLHESATAAAMAAALQAKWNVREQGVPPSAA
jgi:FkbH-like protein